VAEPRVTTVTVQAVVFGVGGHLVEGCAAVCSGAFGIVEDVAQQDAAVPAAHGVGDFAVGEQADQGGPGDVEQVGGFLGGQHRVVRCDRDGQALGGGRDRLVVGWQYGSFAQRRGHVAQHGNIRKN
jgi:hypothetical protein